MGEECPEVLRKTEMRELSPEEGLRPINPLEDGEVRLTDPLQEKAESSKEKGERAQNWVKVVEIARERSTPSNSKRWWLLPTGFLILSLAVLLISSVPAPDVRNQFDFDVSTIPSEGVAHTPQFVHVQLSHPRWIRLDESGSVVVKIGLDGTEMGDLQGWQARLEMNGVVISPSGESRQKAIAGQETIFRWNIQPYEGNAGKGTLWMYQVLGNEANHDNTNLVLAHPFEIQIWNWLGQAGWTFLRLISGAGILVSVIWLGSVRAVKLPRQKKDNSAVSP